MATYYWRGGSGTWDSSSTANWSNVSGGAGGFGPPTSLDDVVFNSASSGVSYVVTVSGAPYCKGITTTAPATGTLTFQSDAGTSGAGGIPSNQAPLFTVWEAVTVNIHAACLFNNPDSASYYVRIVHYGGNAPPPTQTVTFNAGAGAAKVYYRWVGAGTLNFCSSQTLTLAGMDFSSANGSNITCTGSTITIVNSLQDEFNIYGAGDLNLASTTVNMGNATPISGTANAYIYFYGTGTISLSGFSINCVRSYDSVNVTGSSTTIANMTLRGKTSSSTANVANVTGQSGTTTFVDLLVNYGYGTGPTAFTGAVTLNSSTLKLFNAISTFTFGSTLTLNSLGTTGVGSYLQLDGTCYGISSMVFTGAVSLAGTTANSGMDFYVNYFGLLGSPNITFSSTLTINMSAGFLAYIATTVDVSGQTITCAGSTSLTNASITGYGHWVQSGTTTFTSTASPLTASTTIQLGSLSMGTGAASFTSTNIILQSVIPATSTSLNSSALVTVNGSSTTAGVTFSASNAVSFSAATLATWTDVSLSLGGTFTVTGAGGFTLAGTTKNSSISGPLSRISVTGPLTLSAGSLGPPTGIQIESVAASSTLTVNGFGLNASYSTTGNLLNNNTVTGAASFTNINLSHSFGSTSTTFNSTFNWTSALANANTISANGTFNFVGAAAIANPSTLVFYGDIVCNANFAISATSLIDNKSAGATVALTNFTSTNAASTTTFTNARVAISTASIAGAVTLATNGGMYIYGGTATINGALTSSGAGTFFPVEGEGGTTLVLNGAVTLVNANLKVPTITVAGGATKNFAYSLSTPIPDNRGTDGYGTVFYNYPEIAFDTFTLTNTGGTFSIAGGGAANLRTFISPYSYTTATSAAMNLAVNPTFTDVDFWRVVPGGASTKPWTGTRLGNVGTLTNITTDAPKNTWWVGGGGSWGAAKWATSSGGAASINNYPLPQDTVIFDSASGGGNVTLPASIRFKNLNVQIAPSTTTAIYSTATNISNIITNMFMSGSFTGPLTLGGPFIFGNDSAYNFNYYSPTIKSQMNLIVADSSASDTHTIAAQNVQFMPKGGLLFAILGTLQITEDIKNTSGYELAQIDAYSDSNGLINFTCSNVGRNLSSTDWTSTSSNYNFAGGNFNLGGCVFGAANIYTSGGTSIANTPYTVIASNFVAMTNPITSNAGNVVAIFNTGGAPNGVTISVVNNPTYKNISTVGASSTSFIYFSGTSTFNCYNFSVDGPLSLRSLNANKSIVKVGGGKISLSGVKVTASGFRLNASPANTWYVPSGTVGSGSTGWTIASVATDAGGFIFF